MLEAQICFVPLASHLTPCSTADSPMLHLSHLRVQQIIQGLEKCRLLSYSTVVGSTEKPGKEWSVIKLICIIGTHKMEATPVAQPMSPIQT